MKISKLKSFIFKEINQLLEHSEENIPDSRFIKDLDKDELKKVIQYTAKASTAITKEITPADKMLLRYPSLKEVILFFFTDVYNDYIQDIFVVAPKPTTFKVLLRNGQFFYLTYNTKSYTAQISGKKYYLLNIGEKQRALQALVVLLNIGKPVDSKGPGTETPQPPTSSSTPDEGFPDELPEEEET